MPNHNAAVKRGLTQARSYLTSAMVYAGRMEKKRLEGLIADAREGVDKAMNQLINPQREPEPFVEPEPIANDD